MSGIRHPFELTSLHAVLDIAEALVIESQPDQEGVERYYHGMYRPDPGEIPDNFTPEDELDSFDVFSKMGLK